MQLYNNQMQAINNLNKSHMIQTQNDSFLPDINGEQTKKGKKLKAKGLQGGEYFEQLPNSRGFPRNKKQPAISSPINPFMQRDASNGSLNKSAKRMKSKGTKQSPRGDRTKTAEGSQRRVTKSSSNNVLSN